MPLINCKVELKLKWTKYYVLSPAGNENPVDNDNNYNANKIIFTIKDTKLYVPVVTFLATDNQKLSELLSFWSIWKDLIDQFIEMNINKKWEKN